MSNDKKVIGLFLNTWPADFGRGPLSYYRRAVFYKSNPRTKQYMKSLFMEFFPFGEFIDIGQDREWPTRVKGTDMVALLYPDAIGMGFCKTEIDLKRIAPKGCKIFILNGRRRMVEFDRPTRRALYIRRLLERYMIGEMTAAVGIVLATPFLWLWDQLRGKK